jgi:hypothetical protein
MWKRKPSHSGVKIYGKVDRKSSGIWYMMSLTIVLYESNVLIDIEIGFLELQ